MKRIFYLVVVALAAVAGAQDRTVEIRFAGETLSVRVADLVLGREDHNAKLCLSVGFPATCTQAEYATRNGAGTIFPSNAAGLTAFLKFKVADALARDVEGRATEITTARAAKKIAVAGSELASDAACAAAPGGALGTGCTRMQIACRVLTDGASDTCK